MALPYLTLFRDTLFKNAMLFKRSFLDVQLLFGAPWEADFDEHLGRLFGTDASAYEKAVLGYSRFSVDAMRLQRLFNRKRRYEDVSYDDAFRDVYLNAEYMLETYLPGIFVSQFLWRHHYRQLQHYRNSFLPLANQLADKRYYEVGTGTGFFTLQLLREGFDGVGIDLSPNSRAFTLNHVTRWGLAERFRPLDANIFDVSLEPRPCLQCVEVLEHLPNPIEFLARMRAMLIPGGCGFIAVAITAPQADHIYLYWTPDEVIDHLQQAGFTVVSHAEEPGYDGAAGEIVPKVAAFIVS